MFLDAIMCFSDGAPDITLTTFIAGDLVYHVLDKTKVIFGGSGCAIRLETAGRVAVLKCTTNLLCLNVLKLTSSVMRKKRIA